MSKHSNRALVASAEEGVLAHRAYAKALIVPPTAWNMTIDGYRANAAKLNAGLLGYGSVGAVASGAVFVPSILWAEQMGTWGVFPFVFGFAGIITSGSLLAYAVPSFLTQLSYRSRKAQATLAHHSPSDAINLNPLPRASAIRLLFEDLTNRPVSKEFFALACRVEAAGNAAGWTDHNIVTYDTALPADLLTLAPPSVAPGARRALEAFDRAIAAAQPQPSSHSEAVSVSATSSHRSRDLWARAREDHEAVESAWALIVTDPLSSLDHSTLLDVTQPRTAAFLKSHEAAQAFAYIEGETWPGEDKTVTYVQLVRRLASDWHEALSYSEQAGLHWLSSADAATIGKARKLLERALDDRLPPAERALAAQRASETLKGFTAFRLPSESVLALEAVARLQLESVSRSVPEEAL